MFDNKPRSSVFQELQIVHDEAVYISFFGFWLNQINDIFENFYKHIWLLKKFYTNFEFD